MCEYNVLKTSKKEVEKEFFQNFSWPGGRKETIKRKSLFLTEEKQFILLFLSSLRFAMSFLEL